MARRSVAVPPGTSSRDHLDVNEILVITLIGLGTLTVFVASIASRLANSPSNIVFAFELFMK